MAEAANARGDRMQRTRETGRPSSADKAPRWQLPEIGFRYETAYRIHLL